MRSIARTIIATLALSAAVSAAEAASYENASRLAAVMGLEAEVDRAIGDAVASVRTQLLGRGMPAQKVDEFVAAFRDELDAGKPDLLADLTRAYADRFSDGEIEDLIGFYQSSAGRKLVDVQHELALQQAYAVAKWIGEAAQRASATPGAAGANV